VLKEELYVVSVVANFATTAADGKIYHVEYYNLDMIISIGYRVKSQRGIQFSKELFLNEENQDVKEHDCNQLILWRLIRNPSE
jgi:hypothetical protein